MSNQQPDLGARTESLRAALLGHSIYASVRDLRSLRVFMQSHVFAVLDFMSLTKALQRQLTCLEVPWIPPRHIDAARFINAIVLGEETDEIEPGRFVSHFDLYVEAMGEVGADCTAIATFVEALRSGMDWSCALDTSAAPAPAAAFVRDTLSVAQSRGAHEIAAAFLYGREDLVPLMFQRILGEIEATGMRCPSFKLYLQRHIDVDTNEHGPLARRMLRDLCGSDATRWEQSATAAAAALASRLALWNGVDVQVRDAARATVRVGDAPMSERPVINRSEVQS